MARLKSFNIAGMCLWFWPNDHIPPHFHAKRDGQWEVCVNFLESGTSMFTVVWCKTKGVPRADTKLLEKLVRANRAKLLEEWEKKVQQDEN